MSFRLNGKAFFLTYPQCPLTRTHVLDRLSEKLVGFNLVHYAIAKEAHEDGSPHLHCLLLLEKSKNVCSSNFFDIDGYHGNYQIAKDRVKVFDYISKSDGELLTNLTNDDLRPQKKYKREEVGKRVLAGEKLSDLVEEYPSLIFGFNKLQEDIKSVLNARVRPVEIPKWLPNSWGLLFQSDSTAKRRHYWIWSDKPNRGKTTWARDMEAKFGAYIKSGGDFTYWNIGSNESICILDEYNYAGLKFHQLNSLCDGTFEARVFMGGLQRFRPKLVFVLSNISLRDMYPFKYELLEARFFVKELL